MHGATKDCTCAGNCGGACGGGCGCDCCGVPWEFARLRYYFGQRLGVVDMSEEQGYHVGKHRLHNLRAHGVGVLCGLRAERFVFPQGAPAGTPTTVLRITRGAALDGCGREVIVPGDHCIDVASWYLKHRNRPELAGWLETDGAEGAGNEGAGTEGAGTEGAGTGGAGTEEAGEAGATGAAGERRLWVVLRFRECPSDPGPAPRDPCGCDADGCEYGRVRESFELALVTAGDRRCARDTFPTRSALGELLAGLGGAAPDQGIDRGFAAAVHRAVAAGCPAGQEDAWLCLASFTVTLTAAPDGTLRLTDIGEPDNAIPERESLLTTAALQALLAQLAVGAQESGVLGSGPRLTGVAWESSALDAGVLTIPVALAPETPAGVTPLADATFDPASVTVQELDATFAWAPVTPGVADITYQSGADPRFRIAWTGAGGTAIHAGRFRLTIAPPFDAPVVDQRMQPLRPARFARHFRLEPDPTNSFLTLAHTPA